jgi:uncharacterized membrane protein
VIIMVGAHVTDAWTRLEDRGRALYMYTVFIAGFAAPLFLFLAGLTTTMAASSRVGKVGHREAAAVACKRGLQIFALAFLFRLQSQLLGWGAFSNFLKVDILNVMGIAITVAAVLWACSERPLVRILLFAAATAAVAMTTPLVREAAVLAALPDPIEAYIRPLPGRTNFALFPWAAFVFPGAIAGELIAAAKRDSEERRLQAGLLLSGLVGIAARRPSSSSVLVSALSCCRLRAASIVFMPLRGGSGAATSRPRIYPAASSPHSVARRCLSIGFTSRWRTAASPAR